MKKRENSKKNNNWVGRVVPKEDQRSKISPPTSYQDYLSRVSNASSSSSVKRRVTYTKSIARQEEDYQYI